MAAVMTSDIFSPLSPPCVSPPTRRPRLRQFIVSFVLTFFVTELTADEIGIGPTRSLDSERVGTAWSFVLNGPNPHFLTEVVAPSNRILSTPILAFEYFATKGISNLKVGIPVGNGRRVVTEPIDVGPAEGWVPFRIDLRHTVDDYATGPGARFTFQFGGPNGERFQLRAIQLVTPNADEQTGVAEKARLWRAKETDARDYRFYLQRRFELSIDEAVASKDAITLDARAASGKRLPSGQLYVAEFPTHVQSFRPVGRSQLIDAEITRERTRIKFEFDRFADNGSDRTTCRYALVESSGRDQYELLTPATYVGGWAAGTQRQLDRLTARSRKGLGGIPRTYDETHEIFDLGISHATVNVVLNRFISSVPQAAFAVREFEGVKVYVNEKEVEHLAKRVAVLRKRDVVPSLILLIGNRRHSKTNKAHPLVHPEASSGGKFAMPDLATEPGARLYRAVITILADQLSSEMPGGARIANWIMHNEVDQAGTWTTMGQQPVERYVETLVRSARMTHQIARSYDPNARVFISLTHHWAKISSGRETFRVRDIIDIIGKASNVEGDFEWGVAYHPYPQSLFDPAAWNDRDVTNSFDTPYITPKNLGVLSRYLAQPRLTYNGKPRAILLSEQGANARSLSEEDQKLQAAGIVYQFRKLREIPSVEAYHYHAYRDSPLAEGGLRLGLSTENGVKKFAWGVYKAIATPDEPKATAFADEIIRATSKEKP